ncbi:hypothetical protein ACP70R_043125 [Stipagrostis hirtigluma subsp. patula]
MFAVNFMEAGGCLAEFDAAGKTCEEVEDSGGDVGACARATAALRRCMAANEAFFQHYIRAMDEGIKENERSGYGNYFTEGKPKWRWWCNMRRGYW